MRRFVFPIAICTYAVNLYISLLSFLFSLIL